MSKVKGAGSTDNVHKTAGKRLGVKKAGGQSVKQGNIIVRQAGRTKLAGPGTYMSRNFSIHAAHDGTVEFVQKRIRRFSGKSVPRTEVRVNQ